MNPQVFDSLEGIRSKCLRCGKEHQGAFPYCTECEVCSECEGTGVEVSELKGEKRLRACGRCRGKGWTFASQKDQEELFARLF